MDVFENKIYRTPNCSNVYINIYNYIYIYINIYIIPFNRENDDYAFDIGAHYFQTNPDEHCVQPLRRP